MGEQDKDAQSLMDNFWGTKPRPPEFDPLKIKHNELDDKQCVCSDEHIGFVVIENRPCGKGGCPYGGDL